MKDLISAGILALICIGLWAAIPIFGIIAGTGMAILFLSYIIKASKENDRQDNELSPKTTGTVSRESNSDSTETTH